MVPHTKSLLRPSETCIDVMDDDGDVDIYSDVGEFCAENKHDAKDLLSAASADLDLLDTSVLPRQETPVKTNDRPPLIAKKPEVSSVPDDLPTAKGSVARASSANTRNTPSNVGKAIAALKKENGILRHNISVLYLTAKHLVDSKDKEIAGLKRRLDNVVFKRNQGAQDYPSNAPKTRGVPRRRSRSPHDHPPGPSGAARSCQEAQPQKRCHSPERPVATKPKIDMSEDLQRLYEYNNVRPRNRTEFSKVPLLPIPLCKKEITSSGEMASLAEPVKLGHGAGLGNRVPMLALTPRKREIASSSGMSSPTKSAAQRNARRLIKNSIKNVVSSPTKRPRRLEVHRTVPFKGRRLVDRAQVPLKKQPMESSACQPNKGVSKQQNKRVIPHRPLESQETSAEWNKPLDKAPPSENSISEHKGSPVGSKHISRPSVEERSPLRFSPGRNSKLGTHSLKGLVDSHHIPPKRRRSRSRSLSRSPSPRPCSPRHYPPHSRKSLHDHLDFSQASHRSLRHRHRSPERQYSSPEARGPRQRSQERRSPVPHRHPRLERNMPPSPPPRLSPTSPRELSPGPGPRSPYYEDKGFGYLSSPPRHFRASQRQLSLERKPRSPYREDKGLGQLPSPPRLLSTSQRLVSPGWRPKSPNREGKGLGQPPSPPRLLRTSQRRVSPGRRPRSPYCEDKASLQSGSPPRIAGISRRQRSPGRRPRSPCDGDVGLVHPASPPRLLGTSRRQRSPGRRPRSPYDVDMGLVHSASPPQLLSTSRRQHSPGRRPRSPYDGDKGLRRSRMSRKQLSPARRPTSPCGVDRGLGHCTTGKTLTRKPTKTAPGVALSSVVVVGNAVEQTNGVGASKPHEGSGRVLEEGELSDSD